MQVQAARGLVGERTKAGNTLPIEVQFGAVLPAKNDRVLPPPGFSLGDARIEDVLPAQRALVGQSRPPFDQPTVLSAVPQFRSRKFFRSPSRHRHLLVEMTTRKQEE